MKCSRLAGPLAVVTTLTACGTPPADPGVLTVATSAPPASLDFTTTGGAAAPQALMGNVYETLVLIDDSGTPQPFLAASWDVSDDRTVYTFHLREGVTFSDGLPFTAHDAAFSINYVQSSWTNGLKAQMDPVRSAEAVDDLTLRVELTEPTEGWLWSMGTLTGAPKLRATELLRGVEGMRRGSYGGAVGYLRGNGDFDTCIVIRSAYVQDGTAVVQAGAGVVKDSVPQAEADETVHKAYAVLHAIAIAHGAELEVQR